MKVLVYSHVALWPAHHAEAVEIALKHRHAGDQVTLWWCDGELASCPANAHHDASQCRSCVRQTSYTLRRIFGDTVQHAPIRLHPPAAELPVFDSIDTLARFAFEGVPFGEMVLSQLVGEARDSYLDFDVVANRATALLRNSISLYQAARRIIRDRQIEKVYVWNGRRCSDGPVAYAAMHENADYNVYISGGRRNAYLARRMPKVHALEDNKRLMEELYQHAVVTKGRDAAAVEAKIFFDQMRFGGGDYPGFIHFAANYDSQERRPERPISVLIFTSSFWEYFAMGDYLHEYPPYRNHYDALQAVLNDPRLLEAGPVTVRWHPNLKTCGGRERAVIDRIMSETGEKVVHIPPESTTNSYSLLSEAEKIVTFGSTIGIEAAYYGKPSILLGRAIYEDSGSVYRPRNHEDFLALVRRDLPALPNEGAVKYGHWARQRANQEFEYLNQDVSGAFFHGNRPLRYLSPYRRMRSGVAKLAKALGVYQELRALVQRFSILRSR